MQDLSAAVAAIYAAVPDQGRWAATLDTLCDILGADRAALTCQDTALGHGSRIDVGYDLSHSPGYFDGFAAKNLLFYGMLKVPLGTAQCDQMMVNRRDLEASDYYNEFMIRHDSRWCMGFVISRSGDDIQWLSLGRSAARAAFDMQDVAALAALVPHLRCAVEASRQLSVARAGQTAAEALLDGLRHGVVVLDGRSKVLFANAAVRQLERERDGFGMRGGALQGATQAETAALAALTARAARGNGELGRTGGALALRRPSGRPALSALVTPLPVEPAWNLASQPTVAVLISDPTETVRTSSEVLRAIFALTRREADLAALLAAGDGLQTAADRLGIGRATARTHLARLFAKTDTHRQADLVRLLAGLGIQIFADRSKCLQSNRVRL